MNCIPFDISVVYIFKHKLKHFLVFTYDFVYGYLYMYVYVPTYVCIIYFIHICVYVLRTTLYGLLVFCVTHCWKNNNYCFYTLVTFAVYMWWACP